MCNIMRQQQRGKDGAKQAARLKSNAERMECRRNFGYVFNFLHALATRGPLLLLGVSFSFKLPRYPTPRQLLGHPLDSLREGSFLFTFGTEIWL